MASKIVLPAVLLIALAFGSGDALQCYECIAVGGASTACNPEIVMKDPKSEVTCTLGTMTNWHGKVLEHSSLETLAEVFRLDASASRPENVPMSCVKIDLRVDNQPVTMKTCMDTQSTRLNSCQKIRNSISSPQHRNHIQVEYCGLCEADKCNGSYTRSPTMIFSIVPLLGSILMNLVYNSA